MIGFYSQVKEWKERLLIWACLEFVLPNIRRIRDDANWGDKGAQTFRLDLSMGPKRMGVSLTLSPSEGRQPFSGNVVSVNWNVYVVKHNYVN